jgi:hypothetical protein
MYQLLLILGPKLYPPPHYASINTVWYGQSMLQHKGGLRNVGVGVLPSYSLRWRKTDDRLWKSLTTNQVRLLPYTNSYSTQVQSRKIGVCLCDKSTTIPWSHKRQWSYSSTYSQSWRWMHVSNQLHSSAVLPTGRRLHTHSVQSGWDRLKKAKFTIELSMKFQRKKRGKALLFL